MNTLRVLLPQVTLADPHLATDSHAVLVIRRLLFESLIDFDGSRAVSRIAESWINDEGGRRWTFRIKKGVLLPDGRELGPRDVAYSLKRAASEDAKGQLFTVTYHSYFGNAEIELFPEIETSGEAESSGPRTLVLRNPEPIADLNELLGDIPIVPEGWESYNDGTGTGAFVIKEAEEGYLVLERREKSENPRLPDKITFEELPDPQERLQKVEAGEADLALDPPAGILPADSIPADTRSTDSQPPGSLPAGSISEDAPSAGSQSPGSIPANTRSAGSKSPGSISEDARSAGSIPAGSKSPGSLPANPLHTAAAAGKSEASRVSPISWETNLCVIFYINCFRPELNDPRVRRAINLAVDVESIIKTCVGGHARPLNGPLSPRHFACDPSVPPYPHDPEEARALLSESGLDSGFVLEIHAPTTLPSEGPSLARAIAADLEKAGITPRVVLHEDRYEYARKVAHKELDGLTCFDSSPPSSFKVLNEKIDSRFAGPWWQGYRNNRVNELLSEAAATPDREVRQKIYHRAYRILHNDPPWLFLYNPNRFWAAGEKGKVIDSRGFFL